MEAHFAGRAAEMEAFLADLQKGGPDLIDYFKNCGTLDIFAGRARAWGAAERLPDVLRRSPDALEKIRNWDKALVTVLETKCSALPGLANEMAANLEYFIHFKEIFDAGSKKWWYNYGLLGEHFRQTGAIELKPNFLSVCNGVPPLRSALSSGNELSNLGGQLEVVTKNEIGKYFKDADPYGLFGNYHNVNLPDEIVNKLNTMWSEGYRVLVTEVPTKLPTGESPRPDMLFFKTEANGNIDFNDVMYFDSKLDGNTKLSGSQKALSDLSGTGTPFEITIFNKDFNPEIFQPQFAGKPPFGFSKFEAGNVTLRNAAVIGTEYRASDLFNGTTIILKTKQQ